MQCTYAFGIEKNIKYQEQPYLVLQSTSQFSLEKSQLQVQY